ncbi:protein of unknown function [Hyphomicrobium sp. MC1]|nr:protein of unknown function [Hyphomicrobium sp. MC1]
MPWPSDPKWPDRRADAVLCCRGSLRSIGATSRKTFPFSDRFGGRCDLDQCRSVSGLASWEGTEAGRGAPFYERLGSYIVRLVGSYFRMDITVGSLVRTALAACWSLLAPLLGKGF